MPAARLLLIRHSIPEIDATIPPAEWRLSHAGREACRALADRLTVYTPTLLVSSVEPKAVETAQLAARQLGIPTEIALGLHEGDRSKMGFIPEAQVIKLIKEFFEKSGEPIFGVESADEAHARFSAAVNKLLDEYPEETLGIVSHSSVISLFVARANGLDVYEYWRKLAMPDVVLLALPDFTLAER